MMEKNKNNRKNQISRITVSFMILLFVVCLTLNVFFCGTCNLYDVLDKTTEIDTSAVSEGMTANGDGDYTARFKPSFTNKINSHNETITKKTGSIPMGADILKGISLLLIRMTVVLFFFVTFFILLPDVRTLINQKVRLDN